MAFSLKRFLTGIILRGESSDVSTTVEGSIFHNSTSNDIKSYIEGAVRIFVFGDKTQTLTNKTIDADNNTISNLSHGTEVDNPSSGVHGVTGSVVGTSDAQTLTNKLIGTNSEFIDATGNKKLQPRMENSVDGTVYLRTNASTSNQTVNLPDAPIGTTLVGIELTQTLINKTIDADNNTISNLEVSNLKASALDTDLSSVSALHDTLPSAKATKDYVDSVAGGQDDASEITFTPANPANWTVTPSIVKDALDDNAARIVSLDGGLTNHESDTSVHGVTGNVVGTTDTQTLSNKTFSDLTTFQSDIDMQGKFILDSVADATSGSNATLATVAKGFVRLTSGSLVSVDTIPAGTDAQVLILSNVAGVDVAINTSGNIITGTGSPVDLVDTASFLFVYDGTSAKWRLVGGTGSGGSGGGLSEISTNVTSATTGTFTTNISGVPIIVARFWDDSVGQFEDISQSSLTLDITPTGTAIDYDTTGLTFDANDYVKLTAFYNQGVSPTTNDSGWILVSAINGTLKGASVAGYHEIDLPSGFTDDPESFSCIIDDGSNRYPADYASRLIFSNSGAQYRVAFDTTSLTGTDKFRIRTRA